MAVASPGVRADGPWIRGLRARGVPVLSEVELGWMCRSVFAQLHFRRVVD